MTPKHVEAIYGCMYRKGAFVVVMNEKFNFYLKSCEEEAN
jgi:hypothetical protein